MNSYLSIAMVRIPLARKISGYRSKNGASNSSLDDNGGSAASSNTAVDPKLLVLRTQVIRVREYNGTIPGCFMIAIYELTMAIDFL